MSMIRINPIEVAKIVLSSKRRQNELASAYVKKVSLDAGELAAIWSEIVNSIITGTVVDRNKLIQLGAHKWIPKNGAVFSRIEAFYRDISSSIGNGSGHKWVDSVTCHVGSMIIERRKAHWSLINAIDNSDSNFFFNEENNSKALVNLSSCVNVLRKEAAALAVLAAQMEANGY